MHITTLFLTSSIQPGDVINRVRYTINSEAKDRYIKQNAAKFFVGYMVGLPINRFDAGGISNSCEFFQLRPKGRSDIEDKQMFAKKNYNQNDISRSSIVCLAGSVAECIEYGSAEGTTAADVNVLNELIGQLHSLTITRSLLLAHSLTHSSNIFRCCGT